MVPNRMDAARDTSPTYPLGMYFLNACANAGTISATSPDARVVAVEISIGLKEYTKNGYATTFTVTVAEPYKRWEFDMENSNMKGHWIGVFIDKGNETQIDFTENVIPKKWFMKPFVKTYLKKQQKQFVLDLKKALE